MIITGSIVTYKNNLSILEKSIQSVLNAILDVTLYIVDNSPTDEIKTLCKDNNVIYLKNKKNEGFAKGHNQILRKIMATSDYHIVVNPDVYFERGTLLKMKNYMEEHLNTSLVMPKILNSDGTIQYNCKLLPTPLNLLVRRFLFFLPNLVDRSNYFYEMRFADYSKPMEVPYLSGCFMFLRTAAIRKIGVFDERFFLYAEDIDYSRRLNQQFKTIYYPEVSIYHYHQKGSYTTLKLLFYNIQSAIKYFNKWGWLDRDRRKINQQYQQTYQVE